MHDLPTKEAEFSLSDLRIRENRPLAAVLLLCAGFLAYKSAYLVYPDLAFTYPFLGYDSYQWITEGLAMAGHDVERVYRNPGLPLVIGLLHSLKLLDYLPVLTSGLLLVFFAYLCLFLRRHFSAGVVALTVLFFFLNYCVQAFFEHVYSDQWAATFQLIALYHLHRARERSRDLLLFAFWTAVSLLFQFAAAFLVPAALLYLATDVWPRRKSTRVFLVQLAACAGIGAALLLPNMVYLWVKFGNPLYSRVIHFPLVSFHFYGGFYYFINFFSFLGLPAGLLTTYGMARSLRDKGISRLFFFATASYFAFWVLLYIWHDPRFLLYSVPFFAFFFARALEELGLARWFSPRTASVQQMAVAYLSLPVLLLYGMHVKGSPHAAHELTLTPQNVLTFSQEPITAWRGNVTINVRDLALTNVSDRIPALEFFTRYRTAREAVSPEAVAQRRELAEIDKLAASKGGQGYQVALCGSLQTDYRTTMLRRIALGRETTACSPKAPLALYGAADDAGKGRVAFWGRVFKLVEQ